MTDHRADSAVIADREPASSADGRLVERLAWKLDSGAGLVTMFTVALVLRLAIVPHTGFYGDLGLFKQWAIRLYDVGPRHFYEHGELQDYPPGYLYVLWLTGTLFASPGYLVLKLPAITRRLKIVGLKTIHDAA